MTDSHHVVQHQPHAANGGHNKKPAMRLGSEDKVVVCFSLLGFIGSVALYFLSVPSIMVAVFLAAGITALVYRFLGGIQGATFTVGALKLGGAIAALIGVAFWICSSLDKHNAQRMAFASQRFHVVSDDVMLGEWEWDVMGPSASWDGHLNFTKVHDQLTFSGKEYNVEKTAEGTKHTLLLEMTNGKATINDGNSLTLESDVKEYQYNRNFHWKSVAPLALTPAFLGKLRPEKPDDPNLESTPWGMFIYKVDKHGD